MGKIINSKIFGDKIIYKIELVQDEACQLRNHVKNVHLFSKDLCNHNSRLIERGAKKGAKYFIIPLSLKSRKRGRYDQVSYQKIETDKKVFYICVVNKTSLF